MKDCFKTRNVQCAGKIVKSLRKHVHTDTLTILITGSDVTGETFIGLQLRPNPSMKLYLNANTLFWHIELEYILRLFRGLE